VVAGSDRIVTAAQLAVAGGTLALAAVTYLMAKRTHEVASETKIESRATQDLASAARTDRELAWRPQLDLTECGFAKDTFTPIKVFNAGGGAAIGCKILARLSSDINKWCLLAAGDIAENS